MITSLNDLKFYIHEDMKRNLKTDRLCLLKYWYGLFIKRNSCLAFRYLKSLRKLEYATNCLKDKNILGKFIYRYRLIRHERQSYMYDLDIKANMVGYGLYLPHIVGGGIIVNCKSVGNYCAINSGVVLGNKSTGEVPTVGNYVDLTIGCKIIGGVTIGDNVVVAPNSVVVKDVPNNAIVTGIPAKILKMKSDARV